MASTTRLSFQDKVKILEETLDPYGPPIINLPGLRNLCFYGIPEKDALRATSWKLLLGYLPADKGKWDATLSSRRALYQDLLEKFKVTNTDDAIFCQIKKDVDRTLTSVAFFRVSTPYETYSPDSRTSQSSVGSNSWSSRLDDKEAAASSAGASSLPFRRGSFSTMRHCDRFQRILYTFSRFHPGIGYVQGMNEIMAPIYYTFFSTINNCQITGQSYLLLAEDIEADVFFCFSNLMAEIQNNFIGSMDCDRHAGINAAIEALNHLIAEEDAELHAHLTEIGLTPKFYAFRWITLLLGQEFLLPDLLRIWDSLLADVERFDFLKYVCCAIVCGLKEILMRGGFSENLELLQGRRTEDVFSILSNAHEMRQKRGSFSFKEHHLIRKSRISGMFLAMDHDGDRRGPAHLHGSSGSGADSVQSNGKLKAWASRLFNHRQSNSQ